MVIKTVTTRPGHVVLAVSGDGSVSTSRKSSLLLRSRKSSAHSGHYRAYTTVPVVGAPSSCEAAGRRPGPLHFIRVAVKSSCVCIHLFSWAAMSLWNLVYYTFVVEAALCVLFMVLSYLPMFIRRLSLDFMRRNFFQIPRNCANCSPNVFHVFFWKADQRCNETT